MDDDGVGELRTAMAAELSANIGYNSQYIFRGIPQKNSSAFGGLDLGAGGFYLGTWAADVGEGLEIDYYGGYGFEVGDIREPDVPALVDFRHLGMGPDLVDGVVDAGLHVDRCGAHEVAAFGAVCSVTVAIPSRYWLMARFWRKRVRGGQRWLATVAGRQTAVTVTSTLPSSSRVMMKGLLQE